MIGRLRGVFPGRGLVTPSTIAVAGSLLAVIVLLGNEPGLAIIVASLVIPMAAIVELARRDAFEDEPVWASPAMIGWGVLAGIVMAVIASAIASEWWISGAPLHVGAAGFGGAAADREGTPGVFVLLMNGIVLTAAGLALAAIGPYALRRFPIFRNEVMDGVTLGVAAGSGLATGTTIVYVWPFIGGDHPRGGTVADWTAMLIGVLITRPIIFGLAAGLICAGIWHVSLSQRSFDLSFPVAVGVGGGVLFTFGDLLVQPSGTRPELAWHVVMALGLALASRIVFGRAITQDRSNRAANTTRVVCRNCGALTPAGQFCGSCGAPLTNRVTVTTLDETQPLPTVPKDEAELVADNPLNEPTT